MRRIPIASARAAAAWITAALLASAAAVAGQPPATPGTERSAAADYLEELAAELDPPATYRGTATLRAYGDADGSYNSAFARAQPGRGRLEISTPFTGTALVVTAAGGEMLTYYPLDGIAVVGRDDARSVLAFTGGGAGGLSESLDLLAGRPALYAAEVAAGALEVTILEEGDAVTLTWLEPGGGRFQQLTLAGEPRRPVAIRFYEGDEAAIDVTYDGWREGDGATIPFTVKVKSADAMVEISLKKFEADVDLPEETFSTTPPEGVEVLEERPAPYGDGAEDAGN